MNFPPSINRKWSNLENNRSFFCQLRGGKVFQNCQKTLCCSKDSMQTACDLIFFFQAILESLVANYGIHVESISLLKSKPERWKRPTIPTNQHQPPKHHILGLPKRLTTVEFRVSISPSKSLCDQLVTAVQGCHCRNYLGLGKSGGCINQWLEIR